MRVLCFSDLHRDQDAARGLVSKSADADVLIGAGDFATMHAGLADTLDILCQVDKPAILVPGNGETFEELRDAAAAWESATVLHGSGCDIEGVAIWGVGGGIPVTPFGDWSYDFDEDQATAMLEGCSEGGVLVVHSPPFETVDHDSNGKVRGSRSIRQCVIAKKPKLVVCGHIHSDWEKQMQLGPTTILNAGPRGVMVDLPD